MTTGLSGQTLAGRYDLLGLLGSGGMGAVYRAHDRELDETVALKVISAELAGRVDSLARFRSEVKLARRVTHRNVARTFELGHDGGITFCTMELIDGQSLRQRLATTAGRLPIAQAIAIACEICDGLAAAHAAGVIHRDIKPDNVLLASDGRIVLADFGVAIAHLEGGAGVAGTPAYMAPEQGQGEPASPAADVYAVGVVLYEMLTGTRAFSGDTEQIFTLKRDLRRLAIPVEANLDPALAFVVGRATARERTERFASARELAQALAPWRSDRPVAARPATAPEGLAMTRVVVLPARGDDRQLHVALAAYDRLLARLARQPRLRLFTRLVADDADRADAIIELDARDELHVTIARPDAGTLELWLPLTIEELDATAETAAVAICAALADADRVPDPDETEALDLLYRARHLVGRNLADYAKGSALLERASQLAPTSPQIMAALAVSHVRHAFFSDDASDDHLAKAAELVRTALAAGPELVDAHLAAGHYELHTGIAAQAARHFRTAISCAPHTAEAHDHLGRLLIEAGFLDLGRERLDDARASAPEQGGRWELARAWALDGRWDDADREIERLVAVAGGRAVPLARHAWWRRDVAVVARVRDQYASAHTFGTSLMQGAFASIVDGEWAAWRERLVALAVAPSRSHRRVAFLAQLVAEVAGYNADHVTCLQMIRHATDAGMFDLHWVERCPLLDVVRDQPRYAHLRARIKRRADAILDALYGDHDAAELFDTIAG